MLHCYHLGFDHPHTGERLHINMEPDGEMKSLYEALGFLDVLTELIRSPMNDNGVKPI
jgi:hypothetical protein